MAFDPDKFLAEKDESAKFDPDDFLKGEAPTESPSLGRQAWDVAKQIPAGIVSGVEGLVTGPAQLIGMAGRGLESLGIGAPSAQEQANRAKLQELIEAQGGRKGIAQYLPEPQTSVGKYARTGTEFATSMAAAPGRLAVNVPAGIAGGLASEAAGQATAGTSDETGARIAAGVAGTLGPGAAARSFARMRAYRKAPTLAQLDESTDALYGQVRALDAQYSASSVSNAIGDIKNGIEQTPEVAPKTFALLDAAERKFAPTSERSLAPAGTSAEGRAFYETVPSKEKTPVTFDDLDSLRRNLRYLGNDVTEGAAARQAQRGLDNYLASVTAKDVVKGDTEALSRLSKEARAEAAAGFRVRAIETLKERAAIKAQSGINPEATFRGELRAFVLPNRRGVSPAMKEGFNKQEIAEMRKALSGLNFRGLVNFMGRFGGTMGLGGMGAYGYFGQDPHAFGPMALAYGARRAGPAMQKANINRLGRMAATRSPLAAEMGIRPPIPETGSMRADLYGLAKPQLYVDRPEGFKKGGRVTRTFRVKA